MLGKQSEVLCEGNSSFWKVCSESTGNKQLMIILQKGAKEIGHYFICGQVHKQSGLAKVPKATSVCSCPKYENADLKFP